jgi:hydrogenase/urease accessory protein HupE
MVDVLVRVAYVDGNHITAIARASTPEVTLGSEHSEALAVSGYFGLGVEHILTGIDHLLFVLCLILLVPSLSGLLKTITAFSVAHSITLLMSALQWVKVPQPPVEATIALSILFLARELARPPCANAMAFRRPWAVAFAFGLLHGFGFAGALAEVGLPQGDVPLALLLFNLGVEAGQLLFVAGVLPLLWLLRKWTLQALPRQTWTTALPVYAVGAVAAFWWLQRMEPVLGLN